MMMLTGSAGLALAVWRVVRPNELLELYRAAYMAMQVLLTNLPELACISEVAPGLPQECWRLQRRAEQSSELEMEATGYATNDELDQDVAAERDKAERPPPGTVRWPRQVSPPTRPLVPAHTP